MPREINCLLIWSRFFWVCAGRHDVTLVSVKVNGETLSKDKYDVTTENLTIKSPPAGDFVLEIEVDIDPKARVSTPVE